MSETTPTAAPAKNRSNTLLLILVVLLLISNAAMFYLWNQKGNDVEKKDAEIAQVSDEKENVTKLLENMLSQYDTLSTDNEQLRTEIEAQKEHIKDLMDQVQQGKYDKAKLKKETETLRKIMQGYVVTIDSLNQVNQKLLAEKLETQQALGEERGKTAALQEKTAEQEAQIAKGSVLYTTSMSAGALFLRNSGKQVDTERASKAEMVKCCFTLGENRTTMPGDKVLYMRIISPDGSILPASESNNRFRYNNMEGEFSVKRDVNYQNQPVDVCMFWTATDKMASGQYIVEVYEGGAQVGKTSFDLK